MALNGLTMGVLLVAMAFAPLAFAEPRGTSITITSADLDLHDPRDAAVMADRVDQAARQACGGSARFWDEYRVARAWTVAHFDACRSAAQADALARLGAPPSVQAVRPTAPAAAGR